MLPYTTQIREVGISMHLQLCVQSIPRSFWSWAQIVDEWWNSTGIMLSCPTLNLNSHQLLSTEAGLFNKHVFLVQFSRSAPTQIYLVTRHSNTGVWLRNVIELGTLTLCEPCCVWAVARVFHIVRKRAVDGLWLWLLCRLQTRTRTSPESWSPNAGPEEAVVVVVVVNTGWKPCVWSL